MTTTATASTTAATPTSAPTRRRGRAWLLGLGVLLVFLGVNSLMGAAIVASFDARHGDDGFFTARPGRFSTGTHAITSASLDLSATGPDELYTQDLLGRLRVTVDSTTSTPIFVGIARSDDVAAYLGRVAHEEIDETDVGLFGVTYTAKPGGVPASAPAAQPIWVASASGAGQQSITWSVEPGDWTVVLMNADGSAGVSADGTGAITLPILHGVITASLVSGGVFLFGGVALIVAGRRRRAA